MNNVVKLVVIVLMFSVPANTTPLRKGFIVYSTTHPWFILEKFLPYLAAAGDTSQKQTVQLAQGNWNAAVYICGILHFKITRIK